MYARRFKRALDIVVASVLLVLLAPLLLVGLALAAIASRGNPIFLHERPGKNGQPFRVIKLRTMRPPTDAVGRSLSNVERISTLGNWLRRLSIDEIPQLLNVLRGELSLVGPRPLEMRYLPAYTKEQMRRHDVLPGITGLAQVSGRNALSWEEKFRLDVTYVDTLSFALDAKILLLTISKTLIGSGVNQSGTHTVVPFVPAADAEAETADANVNGRQAS